MTIFSGQEAQRAVVGVILVDADGRILLQQRDDKPDLRYPGWWTIFGGAVEAGETPEQAIRREMLEELNIELPYRYWRSYDCPARSKPGEVRTADHIFIAQLDRPVEELTLLEGQAMRLFAPEEAAKMELAYAQHVILRDYLRDERGMNIGMNMLLLQPHDQEAGKLYPLVIFLHGSGERGDDMALPLKYGLPAFMTGEGDMPEPAFVLIPQCPTDYRWGYLLDRLEKLLDRTLEQYPVDPDRVYLTGFSMGGFGSWQWADLRPDRFAALMPVGGSTYQSRTGQYFLDLPKIAAHMPIWMINSATDTEVPVTGADEFFGELLKIGANFGYTRYPDGTHGEVSQRAYWDMRHYEWMFKQRRKE